MTKHLRWEHFARLEVGFSNLVTASRNSIRVYFVMLGIKLVGTYYLFQYCKWLHITQSYKNEQIIVINISFLEKNLNNLV